MKTSRFVIILLLFFAFYFRGNCTYYKTLRKAERCIIDNKLDSSLHYYNKAFEKYGYPFVRDITSAMFIAAYNGSSDTFYAYIEILLKRGLSENNLDYLIHKFSSYHKLNDYKTNYKSYNSFYNASINRCAQEKFVKLDLYSQAYHKELLNTKLSVFSTYNSTYKWIADNYLNLVEEYGFPDEKTVGLGSLKYISAKAYVFKSHVFDTIPLMSKVFSSQNKEKYYFFYNSNRINPICSVYYRFGNDFLWHANIRDLPKLDSILIEGVNKLLVYPVFYASCMERAGIDYGLSWESKVKSKYKFDLKKIIKKIDTKDINSRREIIGIRSLEMDLELFYAISKYERLKYKDFFSRKVKKRSMLFDSFFVTMLP